MNSTWLITSELANQRARKVLFTCVVYTNILCVVFFSYRYSDFHGLQIQTSNSYPDLVNEELKKYDEEVCKYFQVDRRQTVVSKIIHFVGTED